MTKSVIRSRGYMLRVDGSIEGVARVKGVWQIYRLKYQRSSAFRSGHEEWRVNAKCFRV